MMFVKSLVDQYLNAADNDLRYMTLRQDLTICELDQDVDLLVRKVLLPVLLEETDPEIIELVSSQVYPQTVQRCIEKMSVEGGTHGSQWFDDLIVEPLIEQIETKRASFIVQTLRNVLKVAGQGEVSVGSATEKYVRQLIAQMKVFKGKNGEGTNMVLYWDTLDLMISVYYDTATKMTFEVLNDIFGMYEDRSDITTNSVMVNSLKATTSTAATKLLQRGINDSLLKTVSSVWWRFHFVANALFEDRLIPSLHSQDPDALLLSLQTICNLRPLYEISRVEGDCKVVQPQVIALLVSEITELLSHVATSDRGQEPLTSLQQEVLVEDTEMDDDQQAYLDQLQGDDDLEFEELDEEPSDSAAAYDNDQIAEKCSYILESQRQEPREPTPEDATTPDLDHVKVSALTTAEAVQTVCHAAWSVLRQESTLPSLLRSVDILGQLLQTNVAALDGQTTCESLLPHMKQNKSFLQTIKVGSMTQTIDEGSTFRTMVYSTLLQAITTCPPNHQITCKLIYEALSRGVRDTDTTIAQLAIRILEFLLESHYNTIQGIDPAWYNDSLQPRASDIINKLYKKLQAQNEAAQDPAQRCDATIEALTNLVDRLHYFFNYKYPSIE